MNALTIEKASSYIDTNKGAQIVMWNHNIYKSYG